MATNLKSRMQRKPNPSGKSLRQNTLQPREQIKKKKVNTGDKQVYKRSIKILHSKLRKQTNLQTKSRFRTYKHQDNTKLFQNLQHIIKRKQGKQANTRPIGHSPGKSLKNKNIDQGSFATARLEDAAPSRSRARSSQ